MVYASIISGQCITDAGKVLTKGTKVLTRTQSGLESGPVIESHKWG